MKIICYFLAIFTVLNNSAFAQTGNDPDAKKILDAVSAKFKSYKAVQATFTYKVENADGKTISTKKGAVYMKGTKYRVSFVGQEIFCDGNNVWTYDKSSNEVTITKLDNSSTTLTPQKLFTNFYDKDFLYKLNGEKKIGAKAVQEIEMTPNDKTKPFHKVYVTVDKNAKTIYSTKVLEKAGNRYSYTVNTLKGNTNIPDSKFIFNKKDYPGVDEVDLR
ncbi:MAG TPA: outer membrane lipoprotein carrier protein LolA [Chitinophagaceae bacterium]|nr:outer membrane lipoprotein carrier protein LolA [Chitinophagaceae bacterium]